MNLRMLWGARAEDWIKWLRAPNYDHFFCEFNLPAFNELVPTKTGQLLDLGCGEGRVGRHMCEQGFTVYGIDGSRVLAQSATSHPEGFPTAVADAAALPFLDGCFDVVVAFMLLHDLDDLGAAASEIARVLKDGGVLCASIVHPFHSAGWIPLPDRTSGHQGRSYFDSWTYVETVCMAGLSIDLNSIHRPVSEYFNALTRVGLNLEVVNEPRPSPTYLGRHPHLAHLDRIPFWLHFRSRKTRV
jgi:SAM-dependent methyltransferase